MSRLTRDGVFFAAAVRPAGAAARASGPGPSPAWLWIVIGIAVIIGLAVVVLVFRYMGARGSVVTGGWLAEAIDAYEKGSALHAEMSAALRPEALDAPDSGARWAGIQRRADDLAQELHVLRQTAADPEDRAAADAALGSLRAVRSAMADVSSAGGGAGRAAAVRASLDVFERSLRALRSPHSHLW
jgi:hypothetical protein